MYLFVKDTINESGWPGLAPWGVSYPKPEQRLTEMRLGWGDELGVHELRTERRGMSRGSQRRPRRAVWCPRPEEKHTEMRVGVNRDTYK